MTEVSYKIKRINFFGRPVPIFCQNVNGPCPLLAIANILSLRNQLSIEGTATSLSEKRLVSLVAECILDFAPQQHGAARAGVEYEANLQQNMADCLEVLSKLTTGIDVNLRFSSVTGFEPTREVTAFDLLGMQLVHGWLVDPADADTAAALGNRSYNELIELMVTTMDLDTLSRLERSMSKTLSLRRTASSVTTPAEERATATSPMPAADLIDDASEPPPLPAGPEQLAVGGNALLAAEAAPLVAAPTSSPHPPTAAGGASGLQQWHGPPAVPSHAMPAPGTAGSAGALGAAPHLSLTTDGQTARRATPGLGPPTPADSTAPGTMEAEVRVPGAAAPAPPASTPLNASPRLLAGVLALDGRDSGVAGGPQPASVAGNAAAARSCNIGGLVAAAACVRQAPEHARAPAAVTPTAAAGTPAGGAAVAARIGGTPMWAGAAGAALGSAGLGALLGSPATMAATDTAGRAAHGSAAPVTQDTLAGQEAAGLARDGAAGPGVSPADYSGACAAATVAADAHTAAYAERLHDCMLIKDFLEGNASQLTAYGLTQLSAQLADHQLAILFRNNHFSTLFLRDRHLYLLVTDQGYLSEPGVVWERLDAIDGNTQMCNATFEAHVPHQSSASDGAVHSAASRLPPGALDGLDPETARAVAEAAGLPSDDYRCLSAQGPEAGAAQADADADLAMALQLQEQQDFEARQAEQRRQQVEECRRHAISGGNGGSSAPGPQQQQLRVQAAGQAGALTGYDTNAEQQQRRQLEQQVAALRQYEQQRADATVAQGRAAGGVLQQPAPVTALPRQGGAGTSGFRPAAREGRGLPRSTGPGPVATKPEESKCGIM